jgi:hypothetical protein
MSSTEGPKTSLAEDLVKGGGVVLPKKPALKAVEDVSEEALPQKAKSGKLDKKKRKHG